MSFPFPLVLDQSRKNKEPLFQQDPECLGGSFDASNKSSIMHLVILGAGQQNPLTSAEMGKEGTGAVQWLGVWLALRCGWDCQIPSII